MGPLSQVSGFTFVVNPFDGYDLYGVLLFSRTYRWSHSNIRLPLKFFRRSHRSG